MKYHDYMSQFTVIDETKRALLSRMKQRARQLSAAKVKRERPVLSPVGVAPKKKNTFRLHPVRWVAIFTAIALIITAVPLVCFFGFNYIGKIPSIKLEYMKDMMVDTDGVTAYSIRTETEGGATPAAFDVDKKKKPAISLLSATVVDDESGVKPLAKESKSRNYMYSTNESYEMGNVEYDEKGITKVTFKKNTETTENVYDDNGKLIDSDRKITQEELDSQINKLYTTKEYTFIQFVPLVEKSGFYSYRTADGKTGTEFVYLRPKNLKFDEQGVADFDKESGNFYSDVIDGVGYGYTPLGFASGYYSSALSASFIIDNATGYIYKIENIRIDEFENGFVKSYRRDEDGQILDRFGHVTYYSISTDNDGNLIFTDIVPNKDVNIYNVFRDNNGWTYIVNDSIKDVDKEKKLVYIWDHWNDGLYDRDYSLYLYDSDKNVYLIEDIRDEYNRSVYSMSWKMVDGEAVAFENKGTLRGLNVIDSTYDNRRVPIAMDENRWIFSRTYYSSENVVIDTEWDGYRPSSDAYILAMEEGLVWHWADDFLDMLIALDGNGVLYYKQIDLQDYRSGQTTLQASDLTRLSEQSSLKEAENYYMSVGNDKYKINDVYYYAGTNETKYYHVVKTPTGAELVELTSKSYTDNVFIFQPINK